MARNLGAEEDHFQEQGDYSVHWKIPCACLPYLGAKGLKSLGSELGTDAPDKSLPRRLRKSGESCKAET